MLAGADRRRPGRHRARASTRAPTASDDLFALSLAQIAERGIALLPQSLAEAVDALEADATVCGALGDTLAREFIAPEARGAHRLRPPRQRLGIAALRDRVLTTSDSPVR